MPVFLRNYGFVLEPLLITLHRKLRHPPDGTSMDKVQKTAACMCVHLNSFLTRVWLLM